MNRYFRLSLLCRSFVFLSLTLCFAGPSLAAAPVKPLVLKQGDHICYIGNTMADRMQHHAWLETMIHASHPKHNLTFRDLGFPGDEVKTRPRSANFGSPDQWLTKCEADVVFCFFGYSEALRGEAGLDGFKKDLAAMIDNMSGQKYNGKSAPTLVLFSPIAHENLKKHFLPDGTKNNKNLAIYSSAMRDVCAAKDVRFVDLFTPTQTMYQAAKKPLTMNGIHLLDHGNRTVAQYMMGQLFSSNSKIDPANKEFLRLREAVLDKNYHWFSRYRVVDGYNVYGGRSKLNWNKQSNADVMRREMEIFDVKTANRDKRIWAVAQGGDSKIRDDNLPELLKVITNKPGKLKGGKHPYFGPKEAIKAMTIAKGMQVNVFASEEMFPEMINPVQMAVDTDGRLFASVWPSYPHWNPTKQRHDRIVCLPDENGDGVADKCIVFADKLNSITGFEFWGGGMLVSSPPEIWFLKDTDGDDKADVKIRLLQGLSSADTHHTANGFVVGPEGCLYWSRGVFHVTNMETPTTIFRSTSTGVYKFDPRTFEISFHFPIGPNPHGDVFDQWGYQFVNDGTSGTGSYVNIGHGVGNKQWFKKQWRPVAATGILSSSHFPEHNNGNFLICNTIGFLGILQHKVKYNGADITAEAIEPILRSSDPNFRPTDLEIGGDGALYVSDWCNVLIGHMQHNMRDPNRDAAHGRIYRITYKGRPLVKRVKMKGKPIETVCDAFYEKEKGTRYRARLELSGREMDEVVSKVGAWAKRRNVSKPEDAQALLECLWVFEEQRVPNMGLLTTVFRADEPRVRAAAIRTLGHWGTKVKDWQPTLIAAARDKSALVRAEAVKAAISFEGLAAAEAIFQVAAQATDSELDVVLRYARGKMNVDQIVQDAIKSGKPLSFAAQTYVLRNASIEDLLKLNRTEAVYKAILSRKGAKIGQLREALSGLAKVRKTTSVALLLNLIEERDASGEGDTAGLGQLLSEQGSTDLKSVRSQIRKLALAGKTATSRRLGYAAWISADKSADDAYLAATASKNRLRDFLGAVAILSDKELRGSLYDRVRSLVVELPINMKPEAQSSGFHLPGIKVDYFYPSASNVAIETLAKMKPKASGIVPVITMNVPQRKKADRFALRFTGMIQIPKSGRYTFSIASDDGSRIYIGNRLVVNNDGLHGMVEKSGRVKLSAGSHPIVVTYFDNGGGDGLRVMWSGPGFPKQSISPLYLRFTGGGGETLHDVAIRTLASIPGHETDKFRDLAAKVKAGENRESAIRVLRGISKQHWPKKEVRPLIDNLIGMLTTIPAQYRTSASAVDAIELAKSLSASLPAAQTKTVLDRLKNLNVRVIAIGTVPQRMIYDKEQIAVQAGKPVEFRFSNTDEMPHNFAILLPGALEEIGLMAEATARDPDAMARHYIPKSDKILLASRLLQPGENQAISFQSPKAPGIYPYVCTYPGHWRRMYGTLYVVADLQAYRANPAQYLASNPLPVKDKLLKFSTRGRQWKFEELASHVKKMPMGRSYDVGRELFKVSSCTSCHKMNNEGQEFGPDLAKLEEKKYATEHILRSLIDPSKDIDDKYLSQRFLLDSGESITGMIVKETDEEVQIVVDPIAKGKPTVIAKEEIDARSKSDTSLMPKGLLDKLSREEILDLIAYVQSRGNKKHMLYDMGHDHSKH